MTGFDLWIGADMSNLFFLFLFGIGMIAIGITCEVFNV